MRCVSTRVLPLPAPASISSGPSPWVTASRCGSLSPSSSSLRCSACGFSPMIGSIEARPEAARVAPAASRPRVSRLLRRASAAGWIRSLDCPQRAHFGGLFGIVVGDLADHPFECADAAREALNGLGDRVGEVDPVGIGTLDATALDAHGVAGIADDGAVRRYIGDDDAVGADLRAVSDRDRPEELRAGSDRDVVFDGRVALAGGKAGAAERDALVQRYVVTYLGCFTDDYAGAVDDEEPLGDGRGGVYLEAGVCRGQ